MTEHATVSSKGQLVIPAVFRKRLGIKAGTQVAITEEEGFLRVEPVAAIIQRLRGSLKSTAALRVLLSERRKERSR